MAKSGQEIEHTEIQAGNLFISPS